jgi:hypothetical protein
MLDRPLPCLIRTLPTLTHRDQLICRHRHLVSHHSTAIPSARHIQQSFLTAITIPQPHHHPPTQLPSKLHPGLHTLGTRGGTRPYSARIDIATELRGISPGRSGAAQLGLNSLDSPVPL